MFGKSLLQVVGCFMFGAVCWFSVWGEGGMWGVEVAGMLCRCSGCKRKLRSFSVVETIADLLSGFFLHFVGNFGKLKDGRLQILRKMTKKCAQEEYLGTSRLWETY